MHGGARLCDREGRKQQTDKQDRHGLIHTESLDSYMYNKGGEVSHPSAVSVHSCEMAHG